MSFLRRLMWYPRHCVYLWRIVVALPGRVGFECPICGYRGPFGAYGMPPRLNARCLGCGSPDRHRLFRLLCERHGWLDPGADLLHFAPEPAMTDYLRDRVGSYRSADLLQPADLRLDIERLDLPDAAFDLIVCSHVLEHVDDARALAECHRVLRPGGMMLAMMPVCEAWDATYEDPAIVADADRELHFGQRDHLRYYGRDIAQRFASAGFAVEAYMATPAECVRYALMRGEKVFVARRGSTA